MVVLRLLGHQLDHLIVLVLHLLCFLVGDHLGPPFFRKKLWLAIGVEDIVQVRQRGQEAAILYLRKGINFS